MGRYSHSIDQNRALDQVASAGFRVAGQVEGLRRQSQRGLRQPMHSAQKIEHGATELHGLASRCQRGALLDLQTREVCEFECIVQVDDSGP